MKKLVYLFLALLLPSLVFVFLKYAGSNRFDIPIYYEDGLKNSPRECPSPEPGPYRLPDSVWQRLDGTITMANVVIFSTEAIDGREVADAIREEIGISKVTFIEEASLSPDSLIRSRWKRCTFSVESPWQTVLFDSSGRIRGYYDLRSREEIDRLRVELKVLVQQ